MLKISKILETNVLIIGKSGVGKSSLLNYIFDKELMETGTGRPVTKKGIFTEELKVSDNFIVKLSDTWGLEANKAKEWEELIKDEIKKHDCEDISDWFHTILFCISAKSSRIEDFEKKIIKGLIEDGNKIIVILTHSDTNNIEGAIDKMRKKTSAALEPTIDYVVCKMPRFPFDKFHQSHRKTCISVNDYLSSCQQVHC